MQKFLCKLKVQNSVFFFRKIANQCFIKTLQNELSLDRPAAFNEYFAVCRNEIIIAEKEEVIELTLGTGSYSEQLKRRESKFTLKSSHLNYVKTRLYFEVLNQFQQNFMVPQGVFMDTVESTWDPKDNEIMISGSKVENKKAELPRKIEIKVKQDNVEL